MKGVPLAAAAALALLASGCAQNDSGEPDRKAAAPESTAAQRVEAQFLPVSPGHLINRFDVRALQDAGLDIPFEQVVDSLLARPELIPYGGELGGTMGFHARRQIHLLDNSWIYAEFDDGHIQGRGLFEYQVLGSGSLEFKVLYSTLD